MLRKALLYMRTIRRLRPVQVTSRLRGQRVFKGALPEHLPETAIPLSIPALDVDSAYAARFDVDALSADEFYLINERHRVSLSEWNAPAASHLWNFNLHYFEYCIPLAVRFRERGNASDLGTFKRLVQSWIAANEYPKGDAWHPYTISLRLVNWLICADLFGEALTSDVDFARTMHASMYRQYRHLLVNQETHLLANHYFENLKTLVICALWFDEADVFDAVQADFLKQLDEQILPDGVHYERSLMYHKLILEGLLRVALAYRAKRHAIPEALVQKVQAMLNAMTSIEKGMGKTPFFNDSADGVAKECNQLVCACNNVLGLEADDSLTTFSSSGFYKLYYGDAAAVFFAGEPGPSFMLGHAHCDVLSFELSLAGEPVIVNSGTYAYQSDLRPYFRSTEAHNTATIDDEEQMECWGEHRVARGVRDVRVEEADGHHVVASFRNYKGSQHRRSIEFDDGKLSVTDSTDSGNAKVVQHFHVQNPYTIILVPMEYCDWHDEESVYSTSFDMKSSIKKISVSGRESTSTMLSFKGTI